MAEDRIGYSRRSVLKKGAIATGALVLGGAAASGTAAAGIGDGRVLDYHLNNVNYDKERGKTVAGHVHDASSYDNNGEWINENNDPVVKGPVGNAYNFEDDEEDRIKIADPSGLEVEEVTISAWIYPGDSEYEYIVDGPGHNYYLKMNDGNNKPELGFFNNNGFNQLVASALPTDEWSHVAATYDQNNMKIYIEAGSDDETKVTESASGPIQRYSDDKYEVDKPGARVGRYLDSNQNGAYYFDGRLDEVRVYDRALSEEEIQELADMDEE